MYLLFCGPWEEGGDFGDRGIAGIERFADRAWRLVTEPHEPSEAGRRSAGGADLRPLDRAVAAVGEDLERLRFNTAIATLMELARWAGHEKPWMSEEEWDRARRTVVLLLAPFAPHMAEELWSWIGGPYSVHRQPWPAHDPRALERHEFTLVVQVNGKVRGRMTARPGIEEGEALSLALSSDRVKAHLEGRRPRNVVFVPDRLINLVV
jgi:leucyl-tRNA synthetase